MAEYYVSKNMNSHGFLEWYIWVRDYVGRLLTKAIL